MAQLMIIQKITFLIIIVIIMSMAFQFFGLTSVFNEIWSILKGFISFRFLEYLPTVNISFNYPDK